VVGPNNDSCWDSCPRANIFRERQASVTTVAELKELITYNDWEHDPLSEGDPCHAIACRRDLEPTAADVYPSGAVDAKVSSVLRALAADLPQVDMRLGPTNDQQPTFCWSTLQSSDTFVHLGQPDCFDFPWVTLPAASAHGASPF
jgi:hypothetical protein